MYAFDMQSRVIQEILKKRQTALQGLVIPNLENYDHINTRKWDLVTSFVSIVLHIVLATMTKP